MDNSFLFGENVAVHNTEEVGSHILVSQLKELTFFLYYVVAWSSKYHRQVYILNWVPCFGVNILANNFILHD